MAGSRFTIEVVGFEELNRSLRALPTAISSATRKGLLQGAEPVRQDAGRLSQLKLSGMQRAKEKPPPWSIQRKGQTVKQVYIVPRERGMGPNKTPGEQKRAQKFVEMMYSKAYEPALERNENRVRAYVDVWLDKVANSFNTGGF